MPEEIMTALTAGFTTVQTTATDVVLVAVPVAVGVVALTAGVNFAIKKIKGVLSSAA